MAKQLIKTDLFQKVSGVTFARYHDYFYFHLDVWHLLWSDGASPDPSIFKAEVGYPYYLDVTGIGGVIQGLEGYDPPRDLNFAPGRLITVPSPIVNLAGLDSGFALSTWNENEGEWSGLLAYPDFEFSGMAVGNNNMSVSGDTGSASDPPSPPTWAEGSSPAGTGSPFTDRRGNTIVSQEEYRWQGTAATTRPFDGNIQIEAGTSATLVFEPSDLWFTDYAPNSGDSHVFDFGETVITYRGKTYSAVGISRQAAYANQAAEAPEVGIALARFMCAMGVLFKRDDAA